MKQIDPSMSLLGHAVGIVRHYVPDVWGLDSGAPAVSGRLGKLMEQL